MYLVSVVFSIRCRRLFMTFFLCLFGYTTVPSGRFSSGSWDSLVGYFLYLELIFNLLYFILFISFIFCIFGVGRLLLQLTVCAVLSMCMYEVEHIRRLVRNHDMLMHDSSSIFCTLYIFDIMSLYIVWLTYLSVMLESKAWFWLFAGSLWAGLRLVLLYVA